MTDLPEERIRQLIDYFEGHGSAASRADIQAWIAEVPDRARTVNRLRLAWMVSGQVAPIELDSEIMWRGVASATEVPVRNVIPRKTPPAGKDISRSRIGEDAAPAVTSVTPPSVRPSPISRSQSERSPSERIILERPRPELFRDERTRTNQWMAWLVSACVIALLTVGVRYNWFRMHGGAVSAGLAGRTGAVREVITAKGQMSSLELSDGSRITLGVASRLKIPADFGIRDRTLMLEGEAFISVEESARKPFVVHTPTSTIRVLGTSFGIREYAGDVTTTVTVKTGKVAFGDTVVVEGQQGRRTRQGQVVIVPAQDDYTLAWVNGRIAFDHIPLRDVITELNRWYSMQFVLDDPKLGDEIVTVGFTNLSAEEAADVLDEILNIHHRRTATQILLSR